MKLSLTDLNKFIEECLPLPGSINFTNADRKITIPVYRTTGWMELGVEDDPSGMKSGGHHVMKECVGKLVFHKTFSDWELEIVDLETVKQCILTARDRGIQEERDRKANPPVKTQKTVRAKQRPK